MTKFEYTREDAPNSEWVEGVYHNENEGFVVLDLNDTLYKYDNVSREDVDELVNAESPGSYLNTVFSKKYGPATKLGDYWNVESVVVDRKPVKQFANGGLVQNQFVVNHPPTEPKIAEAPTKEYSLKSVPAPAVAENGNGEKEDFLKVAEVTVTYDLFGTERSHVLNDVESVDEAVYQVLEFGKALGLENELKVTHVEATFE